MARPPQSLSTGLLDRSGFFLGIFLALGFIKWGNPVILEGLQPGPETAWDWVFQSWPARLGQGILLVTLLLEGIRSGIRRERWSKWLGCLVFWYAWQWGSALNSVDAALSSQVLWHFSSLFLVFLAARWGGTDWWRASFFWGALLAGMVVMLIIGCRQHFGGLEATRAFFLSQPEWVAAASPEMMKKLQSERIFGTMVYPNAFAGLMILWVPALTRWLWGASLVRRWAASGLVALSLACLYWSGSKAGWLIAIAQVGGCLLWSPIPSRVRWGLLAAGLVVGMGGFAWKYADYFRKGATSVSARVTYWEAAWKTAVDQPWLGSGPGTFQRPFARLKPEGAEMTRLVHNDYLEQASDSGWPGFAAYLAFWVLGMIHSFPRGGSGLTLRRAAWVGLAGWVLQENLEFGLYIPALSWSGFFFLGMLTRETDRSS